MSESYKYQRETKADIFQEKINKLYNIKDYILINKDTKSLEYKGVRLWE